MRILKLGLPCAVALGLAGCASGSKYQGLDAAGVYRLAQEEFEAGDYGDAAETLDRLLLVYPTFEQAAEAYFLMAEAYFRDEQYITSSSEYTRFLDLYPAHPDAPRAALGVCRSYAELSPITQRDQTFTEQALTVCRNVVADYRGTPQSEQALVIANEMRDKLARKVYESGSYYLRRDFFDSAIIYFEDLLDTYSDTEWAPRALAGIIEAYTEIGYDEEVEIARNRLLTDYPDSPEARALGVDTSGGGSGGSGS